MGNKVDKSYFEDMGGLRSENLDDILAEGEEILWRGSPQKGAYVWASVLKMLPLALIWALIDVGLLVFIAAEGILGRFWYFIVPFFLVHLAPVWIWLGGIIKANVEHKNLEYAITDRRVILKSGVFGVGFTSIPFADITAVNVKVGAIDEFLAVGDVYLNGNQKAVLFDVDNPYKLCEILQNILADLKKPERETPVTEDKDTDGEWNSGIR